MDVDLRLDHQLCFALYAASRAAQNAYRTALAEHGLTYPQYLVLLALWEHDGQGVQELGERLFLDSGTVSPLIGRMQSRGLVVRQRSTEDARRVSVHLTDQGRALRDEAGSIQACLAQRLPLAPHDMSTLRDLARRLVEQSDTEGASPMNTNSHAEQAATRAVSGS